MIKLKESARLEFLIVTGCLALAFILSVIDTLYHFNLATSINGSIEVTGKPQINFSNDGASLTPILFQYLIIYICYLMLCFYFAPEFENKNKQLSGNIIFILLFIAIGIFIGLIPSYFAMLLAIKILFIFFNRSHGHIENNKYYEATLIAISWIFLVAIFSFMHTSIYFELYVLLVLPFVFLIYFYAIYYLIPSAMLRKWKFMSFFFRMLLIAIGTSLFIAFVIYTINATGNPSGFIGIKINSLANTITLNNIIAQANIDVLCSVGGFTNLFTQLFILIPLSWSIYKSRNRKKDEEILTLKTELGKSDATLNFLKSQINPHFLFNALNTLYGTALQEKAERTGEGIQKLGDMMRFMLQENIEDQISLSKDVDYLNNYISLQKLRTSISPDITIETEIEEQVNNLQIAPMLLIPFVENAFKHGISLKSPSHIKITLQTKEDKLYFDVHNSIHIKSEHDPEKLHSGIGLQNVKQRLNLQYPERYELIIRENAKEFFIHLTLQLTSVE